MEHQVSLLVCAAQPGAAQLIAAALPAIFDDKKIHLSAVVAQGPAVPVLRRACDEAGVNFVRAPETRFSSDAPPGEELQSFVGQLFKKVGPDAVLSGLSGPDSGLDELVIERARQLGLLTYSIQDSPGWVVDGVSGPAHTYFVADRNDIVPTLTAGPVGHVVPVGNLKATLLKEWSSSYGRLRERRGGVTFFGQPLWHLDGYTKTLSRVVEIYACGGQLPVRYRPHPLEDEAGVSRLPDGMTPDDSSSFNHSLLNCDIAASCFSTALTDAPLLAAVSDRTGPVLHYCLSAPDIRTCFVQNSQPLEKTVSERPDAFFDLGESGAEEVWQALHHFPGTEFHYRAPEPERIPQTISEDAAAREMLPQNHVADPTLDSALIRRDHETLSDENVMADVASALRPLGELRGGLKHVIPPSGRHLYLRSELSGYGPVFLKSVSAQQTLRLSETLELEARLSSECEHVLRPLCTEAIAFGDTDEFLIVTPFVEASQRDPADEEQVRSGASALAALHKSMRGIGPTARALRRRHWLATWERGFPSAVQSGALDRFVQRWPWLEALAHDIGETGFERFSDCPQRMVHGDLNPGNVLRTGDGRVLFIDFEEAVQSALPDFFDTAVYIERHFLVPHPDTWQEPTNLFLRTWCDAMDAALPYDRCLSDALLFGVFRSVVILIMGTRTGTPFPDAEWEKFGSLYESFYRCRAALDVLAGEICE